MYLFVWKRVIQLLATKTRVVIFEYNKLYYIIIFEYLSTTVSRNAVLCMKYFIMIKLSTFLNHSQICLKAHSTIISPKWWFDWAKICFFEGSKMLPRKNTLYIDVVSIAFLIWASISHFIQFNALGWKPFFYAMLLRMYFRLCKNNFISKSRLKIPEILKQREMKQIDLLLKRPPLTLCFHDKKCIKKNSLLQK